MSMYKDTVLVTGDLGPRHTPARPPRAGEAVFFDCRPGTIAAQPEGYPKPDEYGRWWTIRHRGLDIGVHSLPMAHVPAWMESPQCPRKEATA